jgi:hypothetical protein
MLTEVALDEVVVMWWSCIVLVNEVTIVTCGINHSCNISSWDVSMTVDLAKKNGLYSSLLEVAQKTFNFGEFGTC